MQRQRRGDEVDVWAPGRGRTPVSGWAKATSALQERMCLRGPQPDWSLLNINATAAAISSGNPPKTAL